jgi:hypothetical protein
MDMKYLKYFEANIDWDDWDVQEDNTPGENLSKQWEKTL